jgi:branched-subunit amino acid ABC-type transport system permease component
VSWIDAIVYGILLGGVYALLASGLSLMFGVMRIINLAHGSLALVGAYMALLLTEHLHISTYLALAPVLPGAMIVGYALQRTMLERSLRAGALVPLLTTFGLLIVIANLLQQFFSPDVHSLGAGSIGPASWSITSTLTIGWFDVLTLGLAVGVLGTLQVVLRFTQLGRELRATAEDADTAELVGVNARAVYARATAIAVATAALAGVFYGIRSGFDPNAGANELLFAFEAVVIGGIGSLWGTLGGGIVLGVAQTVGAQINTEYFALGGHVVFLAVLVARSAVEARAIRFPAIRLPAIRLAGRSTS